MNVTKAKMQETINSFLDDRVSQLKNVHKAAIFIGALVLPCVLFYFFIFSPKTEEIGKLEIQQAKLEKEIDRVEKASRRIDKHRAEMAEARIMFAKASSLLPQKQEIPSLLTNISDHGKNAGLDFLSFGPGREILKEFYAEIPVDIKVRGPYHNVGVFLDKISKLSRIVTVSNINMGGPKKVGEEMILDTSFNLVTYRFVEPVKQDDSKNTSKRRKR